MATVTQKGQVTIPKPIRDYLRIGPGSVVEFRRTPDGDVVLFCEAQTTPRGRFEKFVGIAGPGPTTDEIMEWTRGE